MWPRSVAVVLLVVGIDAFRGESAGHDRTPPLQHEGLVGCRFSKLICRENEICVDDGLFGNCQNTVLPKDSYVYRLNKKELLELEQTLWYLVQSGRSWRSNFTQCILINSLIAYRYRIGLVLESCRLLGMASQGRVAAEDFPFEEEFISTEAKSREKSDKGVRQNQEKRIPLDFDKKSGHRHTADRDAENFDTFLGNLLPDELENLKEFVIEEENENDNPVVDRPVKKSPPVVTKVVVHYTPGNDEGSELENEMENDGRESKIGYSDGEDLATAEQMASNKEQKIIEPTDIEQDEKESHVEYAGQQQTDMLQNPLLLQHLVAMSTSSGPRPGLTTTMSSAGAQGKDTSHPKHEPFETASTGSRTRQYLITMYFLCGMVGALFATALVVYALRRHARLKDKISKWAGSRGADKTTGEYQDLCRQQMQAKFTEKVGPVYKANRVEAISSADQSGRTISTGGSALSWTEEPMSSSMDISTGHIILSYMEDHLTNKGRLQKEWDLLCAYDAEPCSIVAAIDPTNMRKNRHTDILPYEHSRVKLNVKSNVSGSDYINACTIMDHDPRNPVYVATQGPLPHTVADFWQMVWEQGSTIIVNLTGLTENGVSVCHRYWPEEGSDLYHIYEVHLISEHVWCDDCVVRSFFLKNLQTNETRTISQFHFLTWSNLGVPVSTKTLLDFRRKVNSSFRGRSCPIIVHCSDGAGRTGTYCLIDMALNRIYKGANEIDIAATLEHIRDQRANMVRTKEQFEFALAAVAEEVNTMVHVPQAQ